MQIKEIPSIALVEDAPSIPSATNPKAKREKLIHLLRGYFACPVLSTLGETGIAQAMLEGPFLAEDFADRCDQQVLGAILHYLHGIGLIAHNEEDKYVLTEEGRVCLTRDGAFSLLASYAEYFDKLPSLLTAGATAVSVNRARNVRGSGQLHARKFFPSALDLLGSHFPDAVLDVGCGDGCFLEHVHERWPRAALCGLDLSETAVQATNRRLSHIDTTQPVALCANGCEINDWAARLPATHDPDAPLVISIWFVVHEFSFGSAERVASFFSQMRDRFPRARILLGEINRIPPDVLAANRSHSIMPEFLLFHELSHQGVLSWEEWRSILKTVPYRLKAELRFDNVQAGPSKDIPASFVWLLEPNV